MTSFEKLKESLILRKEIGVKEEELKYLKETEKQLFCDAVKLKFTEIVKNYTWEYTKIYDNALESKEKIDDTDQILKYFKKYFASETIKLNDNISANIDLLLDYSNILRIKLSNSPIENYNFIKKYNIECSYLNDLKETIKWLENDKLQIDKEISEILEVLKS